jgi:hypothetical protein
MSSRRSRQPGPPTSRRLNRHGHRRPGGRTGAFAGSLQSPRPARSPVQRKITGADKFLRRWVARDGGFDHSIPQTIDQAKAVVARELCVFDELLDLAARRGVNLQNKADAVGLPYAEPPGG